MIIPFLPLVAAISIVAFLVGILVSILPRIGNLSQPATSESAIAPVVGGLVSLYGLGIIVLFAVFLLGALSVYYMIDRRNRHFARQQLLFSTLHRYLVSKKPESANIAEVGFLAEDSAYEEKMRPAGLWALLFMVITPLVGLIVSYNLTRDMRKHDELQSKYQGVLATSLVESGFQEPNFAAYRPQNRDPVLFVILTAITGGLFWIYWYYTLLRDYNEHFMDQAKFEDQILKTLIPPAAQRICGTCGGVVPPVAKFCPNCGSKQAD